MPTPDTGNNGQGAKNSQGSHDEYGQAKEPASATQKDPAISDGLIIFFSVLYGLTILLNCCRLRKNEYVLIIPVDRGKRTLIYCYLLEEK
jgi:hypothetical protein